MELLVSMAVLTLIMLVLLSITGTTQRIWKQTAQRIDSFRAARTGFESMTRRISQATLNTYWDYDDVTNPTRYVRKSELRFLCGRQTSGVPLLLADTGTIQHPTHAIFFQAPLGYSDPTNSTTYQGLGNLLNTFGYYIELASDTDATLPNIKRPDFLPSSISPRTRFRLMELLQPTELLNVYNLTCDPTKTSSVNATYGNKYSGATSADYQWFLGDGTDKDNWYPKQSHLVAENVIALFFLPKLSSADEIANGGDPSSASFGEYLLYGYTGGHGTNYYFMYNSAPNQWPMPTVPTGSCPIAVMMMANQLPPLVQVTMVALDEGSAARLEKLAGAAGQDQWTYLTTLASLGSRSTFAMPGNLNDKTATGFAQDLDKLTKALISLHLNYRVFSSEVSIRGAKWSSK